MSGDADDQGDVIFEIQRVGDIQRVAAIHVASGVEVVLQAPAKAALADVQALALRKLKRRLAKPPESPPPRRRGKLV
ncbi:MAG: hypothetical protein WDM79_05050 [Terricaulis sp.]